MTIVGFNINKIDVNKGDDTFSGNLSISSNINIKNLESANFQIGQAKQSGLKLSFEFSSIYGNNLARIILGGNVLFLLPSENAKKLLDDWTKSKNIDKNFLQAVLNHIYMRCNVQAVSLSKDISLPPPIPMPKLTMKQGEERIEATETADQDTGKSKKSQKKK